jgi:metal-responsive CopG/Arc/MetJ family transcriptional regulator
MTCGSIDGMTARKVKISISLDANVLEVVDRQAAREGSTRSAVMENWLRQVSRAARVARLEEETAAYYDALTPAEVDEDAAMAAASLRAARKLNVDDEPKRRRRPPRRRG